MLIRAVQIENVRGLGGPSGAINLEFGTAVKIPRWIVVAGRNGSGKSTFLQAIASTIAGPTVAQVMAGTFAGWIRKGKTVAQVRTRLRFSDADRLVKSGAPAKSDPWTAIRWTSLESGPEPKIAREKYGETNWDPTRGPWSENPRGWFLAGYGPFRRLSGAPSAEAQRLMMLQGRPSGLASLFREEASLSEAIQWLQQIYLRRLEEREDAEYIENAVIDLLNDGLLPDGMRVLRVTSDGLQVKTPTGVELSLQEISDGYRTVAALVVDLIRQLSNVYEKVLIKRNEERVSIENEGVVLIDEIDVHLHVSWQQSIGFWLKEHFPNIQFIVTTHSPFICQAADEGGLIRLPGPSEDSEAAIVSGEFFNRVVNGSADQAILSALFGLEQSYSPHSAKMREELARLEAATSTNGALDADDESRRKELTEALPQTPSNDVVVALTRLLSKGI